MSAQAQCMLCREFSMVDVTWCSALERLAANLPVLRHVSLRNAETHPNLAAWYAAMNARPSYQAVKSDDWTHNLIARHVPLGSGAASALVLGTVAAQRRGHSCQRLQLKL